MTEERDMIATPFFQPTPEFISWVAENYSKQGIIDAGCGYGHLTAKLLEAGCAFATGIDFLADKIEIGRMSFPSARDALYVGDTTDHPLVRIPKATIIFARPCHSPTWIRKTAEATQHTASAWLYISKPGSAANDLEGFERKRHLVGICVGAGEEEVWEFRPKPTGYWKPPVRWCLIEFESAVYWVRDGETCWYRGDGLSRFTRGDETILEDAWICDSSWLDHTKTTLWKRLDAEVDDLNLDNGWISPEGHFYHCPYWGHDTLVYDYLRRTTSELELEGWVKVQRRKDIENYLIILREDNRGKAHRMTREQVQALLDANIPIPDYLLEEAEGDWTSLMKTRPEDRMINRSGDQTT